MFWASGPKSWQNIQKKSPHGPSIKSIGNHLIKHQSIPGYRRASAQCFSSIFWAERRPIGDQTISPLLEHNLTASYAGYGRRRASGLTSEFHHKVWLHTSKSPGGEFSFFFLAQASKLLMHQETWNADLPLLHLEGERDQKGGSEKRPWGRYLTIHPSISAYRQYAQFSSQAYFRNEDCLDEAEGRTAPQDEEEAGGRRIGGALLPHEHYGHQLHTRGSHLMWELSQERGAGQLQIETRSTYRGKKSKEWCGENRVITVN